MEKRVYVVESVSGIYLWSETSPWKVRGQSGCSWLSLILRLLRFTLYGIWLWKLHQEFRHQSMLENAWLCFRILCGSVAC